MPFLTGMPRMRLEDLPPALQRQVLDQMGTPHEDTPVRRQSPGPKPQRLVADGGPRQDTPQARDSGKCLVIVTSYRRRLLDTDNLVPKYHVDAFRYAGCLHSDAPDKTQITCGQVKVTSVDDERTEIELQFEV